MQIKKILSGFIHFIVWLLFATLPPIIFYGPPFNRSYSQTLTLPSYWLFVFFYIFLFYVVTYYLIPKFYLQKKFGWYAAIMFLLFAGFYFLKPFELMVYHSSPYTEEQPYRPFGPDIMGIFIYILVISVSIAFQLVKQWRRAEKEKLQAVAERKTAELSFLKAQINPHFLFNTLNNIYSLAVMNSPNTAPSIMKLSNIMRYVTDDATKEFVTLDRELDCVQDYINLQSLRLGENTRVNFEVTGKTGNKKIAPLILMTFIENNFKYGVSSHEKSDITIKLSAEEQQISFFCQNKIFLHQNRMENTGIGLSNTRQRLDLAYPVKHSLNICNNNGFYTVHLTLLD